MVLILYFNISSLFNKNLLYVVKLIYETKFSLHLYIVIILIPLLLDFIILFKCEKVIFQQNISFQLEVLFLLHHMLVYNVSSFYISGFLKEEKVNKFKGKLFLLVYKTARLNK